MSTSKNCLYFFTLLFFCIACNNSDPKKQPPTNTLVKGTYAYDAEFLKKHNRKIIELQSEDGNAKILLSADYQGRVMTSTAKGDSGTSFGWINYDLLASGEKRKQFNPVGGEERFWIGPEGGQYSFYFAKGDSFNISNWQVPAFIDTVPYKVVEFNRSQAVFAASTSINNYSGTNFDMAIERRISLLRTEDLASQLGMAI